MLLSSANGKYPPFSLLSYFSVVVCLISLLHHFCRLLYIHSRKTGILFSLLLCSLWWVQKLSDSFWFTDRIRLFVQCTNSLSSLYKHIWRYWAYKMPVRYILSSVWVRLSIFSQFSFIQYVGLCVFSLPISLVMIGKIYILCLIIIIKSEVWNIIHCLGLGHGTMVCAVCLYILIDLLSLFSNISSVVLQRIIAYIT